MFIQSLLLGIALLTAVTARATDDTVPNDPLLEATRSATRRNFIDERAAAPRDARSSLPAREIFERTQAVFARFGLTPEAETQATVDPLQGLIQPGLVASRIRFLDPDFQWSRFIVATDHRVVASQDRDSKSTEDFRLALADSSLESDWMRGLRARMAAAPASQPLRGLRVALDPGHMGGDEWDSRTGKYVEGVVGGRRRKISEGVIATQVALLAERDLTALGATVMLTRRGLHPVSGVPYEQLDVQAFGRDELRASSLSAWFQQLLERGAAAFDNAAQVQAIFSERSRGKYFITREDIDARARKILAFDPDLTLVIHFDSDSHELGTRRLPYTKVYVEGAFLPEEFATREARAEFAQHLYHPDAWEASVNLSEQVVTQFRDKLQIQFSPTGGAAATRQVRPGVFARNLGLSRRLPGHAISYLECMFYNDVVEFPRLLAEDHTIDIDGRPTPYSNRLATVAEAVVEGVKRYAATLR